MDPYSKFCFDKLKKNHPEYLKKIEFETEQDFINQNIMKYNNTEKSNICKYCRSTNTLQRSQQMRSADEGETLITHCRSCNKTF